MKKNDQIIDESENVSIKKRYKVILGVGIGLAAIATAFFAISVTGFIPAMAYYIAALVTLGASIGILVDVHKMRKQAKENKNKNLKENSQNTEEENKTESEQKVKVQQNQVQKQVQKQQTPQNKEERTIEEIRAENRADEVGANTLAVKDETGEICKDNQGEAMIYNINDKNKGDVRKIIVSLTDNELKDKDNYVISIYDKNCNQKDFSVSSSTIDKDWLAVYSNIETVRKEYGKTQEANEQTL